MRFSSILTALLVAAALYFVIMERDALKAMADGPAESAAPEAAQAGADGPAASIAVVALRSEARTVQRVLGLSGVTEAARKVEIRSETTGLVISDPIRKGSRIRTGQILCELDPGTREASLAEATARLREAEIRDARLWLEYARQTPFWDSPVSKAGVQGMLQQHFGRRFEIA